MEPIKLQKEDCCTEMFLYCLSLNEEQVSQVMKWENVKEEIKNECKDGFYIKNAKDFVKYLLTKKKKKTIGRVVEFVKKIS